MSLQSAMISLLTVSVVRPLVLVVAVMLMLRLFRIRHPASQHSMWTLVLIGVVAIPVTSVIAPHFDLAVLPANSSAVPNVPPAVRTGTTLTVSRSAAVELDPLLLREQGVTPNASQKQRGGEASSTAAATRRTGNVLLYIYAAGLCLVLAYNLVGWILLRRIFARSRPLRFRPLRISDDVRVPVAVGFFRPIVMLPRDWRSWHPTTRRAVLAHEFAHIRRKDLATSFFARCVKCLFWFNPLVWMISRKVSRLAEMACDAMALQSTSDPAVYSRILVGFAERVTSSGYRATVPGLAIVGSSVLRDRIDGVFALSRGNLRRLARPSLTLTVLGVPLMSAAAVLGLSQAPIIAPPPLPQPTVPPQAIEKPIQMAAVVPVASTPTLPAVAPQSAASVQSFLNEYCVQCHNAQRTAGGVALDKVDPNDAAAEPKIWERALRTLRTRSMPPIGMSHPSRGTNDAVIAWLENALQVNASTAAWPVRTERLSDQAIAARLANFLWGAAPDEELSNLAARGTLKDPAVLERQVKRMLADPQSRRFLSDFFGGWLSLSNLRSAKLSAAQFPDFNDTLRDAMVRETEIFLDTQLHEDRSALELLTANYTFVNDRLARHYGIPNVSGSEFRRVTLSDGRRAGLLGQASILTLTSLPNRISPTLRGKWILKTILGQIPPDPPPAVRALPEEEPGQAVPFRVRLQKHVAAPPCASCHVIIDPPGYSLENFNAIGQWLDTEASVAIDASGEFPDGTKFDGPAQFRAALLDRRDAIVNNIAEKLLTYALGRLASNSTAPLMRGLEYYEMPAVRTAVREAAPSNYRWSALITGVVKSTPFQTRILGNQ